MEYIRIEKYLAQEAICSRREAKNHLEQGRIRVNGVVAQPGTKVHPERDTIELAQELYEQKEEKETVAVYKPRGVISSHDTKEGKNIFDVFPAYRHLHCVGRLDKESEGLILLSNDGLVTKAVTGKDHRIEKEYLVTTREEVLPWMMKKMSQGMELEDGFTLPAEARKRDKHSFSIILKEGRKHQIRRMANACHLTIESLKRVRIHDIVIHGMMPGNVQKLSDQQIASLKNTGLKKSE
jgi:pseudouridine synthase